MHDTAVYALLFTIGALMSLALCGAVIQALVWVATIAMTVVQ